MHYKLTLCYEGSLFKGWQKGGTEPTVEKTLERFLETKLAHPVKLEAASRTDCGVHATGQVVCFKTEKSISLGDLNQDVPPSLLIRSLESVSEQFNPSTDATLKTYSYHITFGPIQCPLKRHLSWHVPTVLNIEKMREAASLFIGTHDFAAFTNHNEYDRSTIRNVLSIELEHKNTTELIIIVTGKRFLYKMIRNIVGSLVWVGKNKLTLTELETIFLNKNRSLAPMTAPAHGLYLEQVSY